ncbi:hypothetical protein NIES4071_09640 [Calothrix sp. NIES-4071]|nr:hypothetical protein NIES4071_09640 [Calothrix sp. NIES-4071]BAZ55306.1 hypothetical protein NIES4105_09600 [Calothrix sp. NIES-4105]
MKAIKVMANIDEHGQLTLDSPIRTPKNSRVEVIVFIPEEAESEGQRLSPEGTELPAIA